MVDNEHEPSSTIDQPTTAISGKLVLLIVFTFAACMTAFLWIYSVKHIGPFQPLRAKLAEAFPDSTPKVEGGQRKIHKKTPPILRVVMKVDFDLDEQSPAAEEYAKKVVDIVQTNFDLSTFEVLEIHLFKPEPEQQRQTWSTEIDIDKDSNLP